MPRKKLEETETHLMQIAPLFAVIMAILITFALLGCTHEEVHDSLERIHQVIPHHPLEQPSQEQPFTDTQKQPQENKQNHLYALNLEKNNVENISVLNQLVERQREYQQLVSLNLKNVGNYHV